MNYGTDDEEETTMKSKKDENIKSWKEKEEVKVNNAEPEKDNKEIEFKQRDEELIKKPYE